MAFTDNSFGTWLASAFAAVLAYVFPTEKVLGMAVGLAVLIAADTVAGIRVSFKRGTFGSSGWWKVGDKILAYSLIITTLAVLGRNVPEVEAWTSGGLAAAMTLMLIREGISVLEKVVKLGVKLPLGLTDKLRDKLLSELRDQRREGHGDTGENRNADLSEVTGQVAEKAPEVVITDAEIVTPDEP